MNPYLQHLAAGMREILGVPNQVPNDIPQPDPLAETEASEGVCAMEEDDE